MGTGSNRVNKIVSSLLILLPILLTAQPVKPVINSISPTRAEYGENVTIRGSGLGDAATIVFFGSVKSTNVTGSDNELIAEVPEGATHGPITVLSNRLIAQSSELFYISFGGSGEPMFGPEVRIPVDGSEQVNVYDICLCDLNSDNLNDVILTHENFDGRTLSEFTYFINTSTPSATGFEEPKTVNLGDPLSIIDGFVSVKCADLNNDGTNDVVFVGSESLNRPIFIFDDIVAANPEPSLRLELPRTNNGSVRDARGLSISDIDGDGRKDILVANGTDNVIAIFRNSTGLNSTGLSFEESKEIAVRGLIGQNGSSKGNGSIDVADLNNDLLPDVVIIPFGTPNEDIYFLKNNSLNGSISFLEQEPFSRPDERRNIRIGDFNNDGLPDIASTASTSLADRITILQNNSASGGDITFAFVEDINIPAKRSWGLDLGDINGDGLPDIAVSNVGSGGDGEVYILENNTTASDISFKAPLATSIGRDARNIVVGDLNGDAKPDLAYSEGVLLNDNGGLGVQINLTSINPTFDPPSYVYCSGKAFTLKTVNSPNATYRWTVTPSGSIPTATTNEATFTIVSTTDQTIEVEIIQENDTTSGEITVEFSPSSVPEAPTINATDMNGGVLCEGDRLILSTTPMNYDSYLWTLPDGSIVDNPTISIPEVKASDAGTYSLIVRNTGTGSTCSSDEVTEEVIVEAFSLPVIFNSGAIVFCADETNNPKLEIGSITGGSYQWKRNGTNLTGETRNSITAAASGDYTIEVTNANGCTSESGGIALQAVSEPVSEITGERETCSGLPTPFRASSTGQSGFALEYLWEVDSAGIILATSTDSVFIYTFTTENSFSYRLTLRTGYPPNEIASCVQEQTITVNVSPPPKISFNMKDGIQKCPTASLSVRVTNPEMSSYSWKVRNATDNTIIPLDAPSSDSISITTPPDVDSVYAVVDIVTNIGCRVRDSVLIRNYPTDADIRLPDSEDIGISGADSVLLKDGISIKLEAVNITSNLSWEPAAQINDPTAASISFFPQERFSTVTLTGTDKNGCPISTSIIIELDNIRPKKTFSPNGDGNNDCWEILNIGELGETLNCKLYIFDARGRNETPVIDQFDNGNCAWDGTSSGSPVPEGIYYFVLKCSDKKLSKSGSILLAR